MRDNSDRLLVIGTSTLRQDEDGIVDHIARRRRAWSRGDRGASRRHCRLQRRLGNRGASETTRRRGRRFLRLLFRWRLDHSRVSERRRAGFGGFEAIGWSQRWHQRLRGLRRRNELEAVERKGLYTSPFLFLRRSTRDGGHRRLTEPRINHVSVAIITSGSEGGNAARGEVALIRDLAEERQVLAFLRLLLRRALVRLHEVRELRAALRIRVLETARECRERALILDHDHLLSLGIQIHHSLDDTQRRDSGHRVLPGLIRNNDLLLQRSRLVGVHIADRRADSSFGIGTLPTLVAVAVHLQTETREERVLAALNHSRDLLKKAEETSTFLLGLRFGSLGDPRGAQHHQQNTQISLG